MRSRRSVTGKRGEADSEGRLERSEAERRAARRPGDQAESQRKHLSVLAASQRDREARRRGLRRPTFSCARESRQRVRIGASAPMYPKGTNLRGVSADPSGAWGSGCGAPLLGCRMWVRH
mgnify:CR=1 FL=1